MLINFEALEPRFPIELTRDELLRISEEITLKFSPDKASAPAIGQKPAGDAAALTGVGDFSYRELQAVSRDISRRFMPKAAIGMPEILLLPVDPHHLYAYWNAGSSLPPNPDRDPQKPLILRIYWRPNAERDIALSNLWFDIPADSAANRKKVRLPVDDTNYSAALGRLNPDHSFEALAQSNLVHVPASPGKKRFAAEVPLPGDTAEGKPALSPFDWKEMLKAVSQEGTHFPKFRSIIQQGGQPPRSSSELAQLYAEFMSFINEYGNDAGQHLEAGADKPSGRASGLGRL
jgi:hypothetical protein